MSLPIDILGHIKDPAAHHTAQGIVSANLRFVDTRNAFGGISCGENATSGALDNVGIGYECFKELTTGDYNVGIGEECLKNLTIGSRNVGIGYKCLYSGTTTNSNIAIGGQAGYSMTVASSHSNVLIGRFAGYSIVDGGYSNVAIGDSALYDLVGQGGLGGSHGMWNTAIGKDALSNLQTGAYNTAIGTSTAIYVNGDSMSNVFIGYAAGPSSPASAISNLLYIANGLGVPLIGGDFSTDGGRVGILVDPEALSNILEVKQTSATDPIADSWTTYPSDRQHKTMHGNPTGLLDQFSKVNIYKYSRKPLIADTELVTESRRRLSDSPGKYGYTTDEIDSLDVSSITSIIDQKKLGKELSEKKAKLPKYTTERVGISIDDPETPEQILARNGDQTGIDLLAYIGWLHGVMKELVEKVETLEAQVT